MKVIVITVSLVISNHHDRIVNENFQLRRLKICVLRAMWVCKILNWDIGSTRKIYMYSQYHVTMLKHV